MGRSNRKFVPLECSGPGGSGMAEAVLGGTGGHSPFSGLAGKAECRGPEEDGALFLDKPAATREK